MLVLLCVACRFLDGESESEERCLEAFRGVCIEIFEQRFELGSRGFRSLALMDHGHADDDLGMILPFLLLSDI